MFVYSHFIFKGLPGLPGPPGPPVGFEINHMMYNMTLSYFILTLSIQLI